MKTVIVSTELPAPPERVWELLQLSSTLVFVTDGRQQFSEADRFPVVWTAGTRVVTDVRLLGRVTVKDYEIYFSKIDHRSLCMQTQESGSSVKRWNHTMQIDHISGESGCCRYTDTIEIDAGWSTSVACAYARFSYRYRQRRWIELLDCYT
jgi:hypothetical protein